MCEWGICSLWIYLYLYWVSKAGEASHWLFKKNASLKIYNNNNNNNNNSNNNKIHTYISLTCLVWIAFSLNTASDGDNTTSAGSWFHSLEVHGKKENLRAFLELKGVSGIYTHDCSHFASIQWFQPIVYIQILQTYIDIHFLF